MVHPFFQGRAKIAVGVLLSLAVVYNIPRFFELTWTPKLGDVGTNNATLATASNATGSVLVELDGTDLRKDATYIKVYVTWMYLVFMYIAPFLSLAVLNLLIFLEIRRASQRRAMLSNQEKKEHNLASMFLVVVLVFFVCNALPLVVNIVEVLQVTQKVHILYSHEGVVKEIFDK